jgi:hypothetical protein
MIRRLQRLLCIKQRFRKPPRLKFGLGPQKRKVDCRDIDPADGMARTGRALGIGVAECVA